MTGLHRADEIIEAMRHAWSDAQIFAAVDRARSRPYTPEELPALEARLGADEVSEPISTLQVTRTLSIDTIIIVLDTDDDEQVERDLLRLRAEAYLPLVVSPYRLGLDYVVDVMEDRVAAPIYASTGDLKIGMMPITWRVEYAHSYRDPRA